MAMSDAMIMFAEVALSRQEVSSSAKKWVAKTLRHNRRERKIADREYAERVRSNVSAKRRVSNV